ncbi:hypothetical protein Nepgr_013442 [Nepenthes gracilis]|uniref:Uncharacterized protein n=1 Tax=Nepenthes gracilis TaxID=150966 RepID=A0AAD3SIZ7_NEPGR|nr:hypothetical protein Nepgr_013442 [Nepenthes gracilis]
MSDCMAVEDIASEDVPMQCSAHNLAQSQVESAVAEVDTDPLSLGIMMLIKDNNFWLSLNALTPAADFSWFPTYFMSMKMQFVDDNSEAYELTAALMVAGRMVSGPKISGFLEVLFCCQAGISAGFVCAYSLGQASAYPFQLAGAGGWAYAVVGLKFAVLCDENAECVAVGPSVYDLVLCFHRITLFALAFD